MGKILINELDAKVNGDKYLNVDTGITRVVRHIIKTIDPTFPPEQFAEWCDSDDDGPFKWNNNRYYWK